jgi:hypothetical protein
MGLEPVRFEVLTAVTFMTMLAFQVSMQRKLVGNYLVRY